MRARRLAVAGATTTRSAARDSSIWPISDSSVRLKRSSRTGWPLSVAADRGVTKCFAAAVMTTRTLVAAIAEPPDQLKRLVCRDAAPDDEENSRAEDSGIGGHGPKPTQR